MSIVAHCHSRPQTARLNKFRRPEVQAAMAERLQAAGSLPLLCRRAHVMSANPQ